MQFVITPAFFILLLFSSCSIIRQNLKYTFADGGYVTSAVSSDVKKVYVDYEEEDIHVYPLRKTSAGYVVDTTVRKPLVFGENKFDASAARASFRQNSFDIDFLTLPFKYRLNTALHMMIFRGNSIPI